ncbi:MAG: FG-GAP-like repeat-containing protein, partial [Bryobacteraceae bacterium]|nr:FG-GAP-like repeat-containing protein [Bryobacteraceae bacterium]
MRWWLPALLFAIPFLLWCFAPPAELDLERHRNLGKAFYENPTTQKEAVAEFAKALALAPESARERLNWALAMLRAGSTNQAVAELENVQKQDPSLPHTWFNLGIVWKKAGEVEKATAQLERFIALVPDEPISLYNLGALYKASGNTEKALRSFVRASELDPSLAAPHFQLYNLYRTSGRAEDAKRELASFQEIRKSQEGAAIPEDVEWNAWSEVLDVLGGPPPQLQTGKPVFVPQPLAGTNVIGGVFFDPFGDGRIRALTWSASTVYLETGLTVATLSGISSVVPGDFNNDGLADLCVLTGSGPVLLANRGMGKFARVDAKLPAEAFTVAVWLDYDHDYDLDLFLLGSTAKLMRNAGTAGFQDRTADFPFVRGQALSAAGLRVVADTRGFDLVAAYADHGGVLYRDRLQGRYTAEPIPLPAGATSLRVADLAPDFVDGYFDLAFLQDGKARVLANNRKGGFSEQSYSSEGASSTVVMDYGNLGGVTLLERRNLFSCTPADSADRNADGLDDILCVADGKAAVGMNALPPKSRFKFLRVRLAGVRNLKLAYMAEVEVKMEGTYQKRLYTGTPLNFGVGLSQIVDTVRITWPNGLIQNEIRQASGKTYLYKEAQRLSGSCPIVWTWDGSRFRYITDVLGVAPLGASTGDGSYFAVDDEENIQIPADGLRARADGLFEIRVSEELSEAAYLDRIRLLA